VLGPDRRSKGFGFVEFTNEDDAAKAQAEMNETEYEGRTIKVDFAKENPEKMRAREEAVQAESEEVEEESGEVEEDQSEQEEKEEPTV
jgi:RNA recognition motif-containing protein